MGALEYIDVPGYAAIIFRRTFADLALPGAIMARATQWLTNTDARWNEQRKQWTFPSGAILQFGYMEHLGDELRYQSAEFQFVGFDELTQFPEEQYTYLFSRLRRPQVDAATTPEQLEIVRALQQVPLRQRAASNPGGIGHGWVKERFGITVETMRTGSCVGTRVFVPAKIADNPHLDAIAYRASLSHLGETLQKQLEDGDWQVAEGLAYHVTDEHLVDAFRLDDSHDRFEAADYGFAGAPWALVAVDYEGNLIFYDLLYERDMIPSELAALVIEKRKAGWGFGQKAWMDPSVWKRTYGRNHWGAPAQLDREFSDNGVPIIPANNDPRAGMARLRELLKPDYGDPENGQPAHRFPLWHPRAGEPGSPRLFFVRETTVELVKELSNAPVQPTGKPDGGEKVDPEWESRYGHSAAMARYAVMTRPAASVKPPVPPASPEEAEQRYRTELLRRHEQGVDGQADRRRQYVY